MTEDLIAKRLEQAEQSGSADEVEDAVSAAFRSGLHAQHAAALVRLLALPWHQRHEDIVLALQQLKSPDAVDAIFQAANVSHEYLEYDENFALARKCTWALADTGTESARAKLQMLAAVSNATIAAYATQRLENWQQERKRKGR